MIEVTDACKTHSEIGYSTPSYFIIGVLEVIFSICMTIIMFKRNFFPSLSSAQFINYFLPFYLFIVIPLICFCFLIGIDCIVGITPTNNYVMFIKWLILRSFTESMSLFLLHAGIGLKTVRRSIVVGVSWAFLHTLIIVLVFELSGFDHMVIAAVCILIELAVFYLLMVAIPWKYLHRRPAMYGYAFLNLLLVLYQLASLLAYIADNGSDNTSCATTICFSLSEFLQISIILFAFGEDSRFWQGLYVNASTNLNEPLLGIWDMNREAVNMVTQSVFHLERKVVPIIPFSQLKVDTSMYFSGGTARVYKGTYQAHEVAIKFLFCIELTPDRIVDFCNEATMLNSLQHPNIVTCYGVAVMPPAISLVTEFCHYGSLFDFLHSLEFNMNIEKVMGAVNRHRTSTAGSSDIGRSPRATKVKNSRRSDETSENSYNMAQYPPPTFSPLSPPPPPLEENSVSLNLLSSSESVGTKSNKTMDNRVSFQDPTEISFEISDQNQSNLFSYLDISTIDNIDAASRLAEALAHEYNTGLSIRGSRSAHFSKNIQTQVPWTAFSVSRKVSKDIPVASGPSVKLKTPASLLLTKEMGWGLGPSELMVPSENILKSPGTSISNRKTLKKAAGDIEKQSTNPEKSQKSRASQRSQSSHLSGRILSSGGHSSMHSIGNILPLAVRLSMMKDCVSGLAYLHSKGIMHCDIKSLNFLVTKEFKVKLADLGEARVIQNLDLNEKKIPTNINWSSPETLRINREQQDNNGNITMTINQSADIWSIGMVFYEILSAEVPYDSFEYRNLTIEQFLEELKFGARPALPYDYTHITWLVKMLESTWEFDPQQRPSAARLVQLIEEALQSKV